MRVSIDLTDKKFGRLTVIKRVQNIGKCKSNPSGAATWKCRCRCGNIVSVLAQSLKAGLTQSCGCLHRENHWKGGRIRHKRRGYIFIYKPNHPYANNYGYVYEHRLVMEEILDRYLLPGEVTHHINGIVDDNRKENLMYFENNGLHLTYHAKLRREINN